MTTSPEPQPAHENSHEPAHEEVVHQPSNPAHKDAMSTPAHAEPTCQPHDVAETIREVAAEHPDLGPDALGRIIGSRLGFGYGSKDALRPLLHQVLGMGEYERRVRVSRDAANERMRVDRDEAIAALRAAAQVHGEPLSRPAYEQCRADGHVEAAAADTIARRFGGWLEACAAAGVVGETRGYEEETLHDTLMRFVNDSPKDRPTARDYTAWQKQHPDAPTMNTVRKMAGGTWNTAMDLVVSTPATGSQRKTEWSDGAIIFYVRRYHAERAAARESGTSMGAYDEWATRNGAPRTKIVYRRFGGLFGIPSGASVPLARLTDDMALDFVRAYLRETGDRSVKGYIAWAKANDATSHSVFYARFGNWANTLDAALVRP